MAFLLRANGDKFNVDFAKDRTVLLEKLIGGDFQMIAIGSARALGEAEVDYYMLIREDGKLHGLPVNQKATELVRRQIAYDDEIVGDVLICKANEIA